MMGRMNELGISGGDFFLWAFEKSVTVNLKRETLDFGGGEVLMLLNCFPSTVTMFTQLDFLIFKRLT